MISRLSFQFPSDFKLFFFLSFFTELTSSLTSTSLPRTLASLLLPVLLLFNEFLTFLPPNFAESSSCQPRLRHTLPQNTYAELIPAKKKL